MKKLTKTQKQNLKKKLLRTFNIIGLIVGGLSFIVVLYAIIAGVLAANNSENTTAEVSEGTPSKPTLEQRALTPPSSYDLELSPALIGSNYLWIWKTSEGGAEAHFTEYYTSSVYYSNIYNFNGLTITTSVYAPTTSMAARPDDMFAFLGEYIGSAASSPSFMRFRIDLDNRNSGQAFLFYGDFSSSAYDVSFYVHLYGKTNNYIAQVNNYISYYNANLRALYVPPFSMLRINAVNVSSAQYLDRIYIDDIGSTAYDIGYEDGEYFGGEQGYDWGYDVGLEDGYDSGYDDGLDVGYTGGYDDGYIDGHLEGLETGYNGGYAEGWYDGSQGTMPPDYQDGYADGVAATTASTSAVENAFDLIYAGAQSVDKILSISIFGSITLGMLLFTPLIIGISLAVIKIIKG